MIVQTQQQSTKSVTVK